MKTSMLSRCGDALAPLIALTMPLTFFGHTHLQGGFFANGSSADGFRPEYRTVGQSGIGVAAIKDDGAIPDQSRLGGTTARRRLARRIRSVRHRRAIVHFHRTPYNLKEAQDRIFAAQLPARLATRLASGR